MGNSSSTPDRKAENTKHAYTGTIDNLLKKNLAFQLYNPVYQHTLFVSDVDKSEPDFLVESHQHTFQERNHFHLDKIDGVDYTGYCLYHTKSGYYIFVSNDKSSTDHVVEAHPFKKEERNCFIFEKQRDNLYTIFNPTYNEYIFVSNDTKGSKSQNHVILSHSVKNEERNLFEIQLINPEKDIKDVNDNNQETKPEVDEDNDHEIKSEDDADNKDYRVIKDTPLKEDSDEEDNKLCIVCMENEKDHVIVPCGHLCLCRECKDSYYDNDENATCPLCQAKVEKIMKTYQ